MKKYTLTNYAETNATASSSTTDSGIIDSGVIDSGIVDSGLVDSGVVDPDDEEDTDDENGWDYGSYTEAEMDEMMENGTWNGGYVNGVYVMPTVDIHSNDGSSEENTGRGYTGGGNTNGGNTDGGNTDGGNTDEQNNTVPTPDEQSTSGDSTQNGNQSGGGSPSLPTGETNQTPTSPSNGIVMYVDNIPVFSYEYALEQFQKGQWRGGYVMGMDPDNPTSIAYVPQCELIAYQQAQSGAVFLTRALDFLGVPYKNSGVDMSGVDCSGLVSAALGLNINNRWATSQESIPGMTRINLNTTQGFESFQQQLQPGDVLVWYNMDRNIHHAVIYIDGNEILHASSGQRKVIRAQMLRQFIETYRGGWGYPKVYRIISQQ